MKQEPSRELFNENVASMLTFFVKDEYLNSNAKGSVPLGDNLIDTNWVD